MKKVLLFLTIFVSSCAILYLSMSFKSVSEPNHYFTVYLEGDLIGTVQSKKELEKYIDESGKTIKETYGVDKVYSPSGLVVKKTTTYASNPDKVEDVYGRISHLKAFTIAGYQMSIKRDDKVQKFYVVNEEIFNEAVERVIKVFVGEENYNNYINNNQLEISETGSNIRNIYLDNDITIKEVKIATDQKIYTDSTELAEFLIYGDSPKQKKYTVKTGDSIQSVALNNNVSTEELLMANTNLNNENNLLAIGQELLIKESSPQIDVIQEIYSIEDKESAHRTNEYYNQERLKGDDEVIQKGENGLERIAQVTKSVNGTILYVQPLGKTELKPSIDEIVEKGGKVLSNVGTLTNWFWPTISGYTITTPYGNRISPITHLREFHGAIDIAGLGTGSPIYASNNGNVYRATYSDSYGNYIIINHNNGYYTLYAHLSKISVKEGQLVRKGMEIGRMGSTGWSTGAHLHYEIWNGRPFGGGSRISPWTFHKR